MLRLTRLRDKLLSTDEKKFAGIKRIVYNRDIVDMLVANKTDVPCLQGILEPID